MRNYSCISLNGNGVGSIRFGVNVCAFCFLVHFECFPNVKWEADFYRAYKNYNVHFVMVGSFRAQQTSWWPLKWSTAQGSPNKCAQIDGQLRACYHFIFPLFLLNAQQNEWKLDFLHSWFSLIEISLRFTVNAKRTNPNENGHKNIPTNWQKLQLIINIFTSRIYIVYRHSKSKLSSDLLFSERKQ